ncbi:hypothetical protein JCM3766R1_001864 [Sporobolomyces carnicolor]
MSRHTASNGYMERSAAQVREMKEVRRIKIAMAVTAIYMLVELFVGYSFSALVLVADAYHMLSDLVALVVQLYADEIGLLQREGDKDESGFTYGFSRVAFVANLINGVILIALCLMLGLESLQRLYSPETMALPPLVITLGCLACGWNVVMFWMFRNTYDHDGAEMHSMCHPGIFRQRIIRTGIATPNYLASSTRVMHGLSRKSAKRRDPLSPEGRSSAHEDVDLTHSNVKEHEHSLAIHAKADAPGNIAVIVDGVVSVFFGPRIGKFSGVYRPWKGVGYVDPLASLVVILVILRHSLPLVTASSYALMQAFDPRRTKRFRQIFKAREWLPASLRERLHVNLLDLHIWSLTKEDHIATLKFRIDPVDQEEKLVLFLDDLDVIERAARMQLGKANIRDDMM